MATRSVVIVKYGESDYRGIYCHWDGYPSGVGDTLRQNFSDFDIAKSIVELGACSVICGCERVNPIGEHNFLTPEEGTIIAYHRDRGEPYTAPVKASSWSVVAREISGTEFAHVFEDGKWSSYRLE